MMEHDPYCQCADCRLDESLDNPSLPDYKDIRRALNEAQHELDRQIKEQHPNYHVRRGGKEKGKRK